jgi:hypothetical protein
MIHSVRLTDEEVILLDGCVGADAQAVVNLAKRRLECGDRFDLPTEQARWIGNVLTEAELSGRLVFRHVGLRHCQLCGRHAGYAVAKRQTKHLRRGEPDTSKPLHLRGVELAKRFVVMTGHPSLGCCSECWAAVQQTVAEALADTRAELPAELGPTKWAWNQNVSCHSCGWAGHEGQMVSAPTLFGDGVYPAGCPSCGVRNTLTWTVVKVAEGFTLTEVSND